MSASSASWLFTPGSRPDRMDKAWAGEAGVVILDLEDSVAPDGKDAAQNHVLKALERARPAGASAVRVNAFDTAAGQADLAALAALATSEAAPDFVILPKVEDAETVRRAVAALSRGQRAPQLVALVETALGVLRVGEIAAEPGLAGLMFGAADYSADLGLQAGLASHAFARAAVGNAAAAYGLIAVDSPAFDIADHEALRQECALARQLGFHAKAAIHPSHLAIIAEGFAWSAEERERARRILASLDGVGTVDGRMVDEAMARWARRVLDQ